MAKKDMLHITKGQIDSTIAAGIHHAFMYNNGARRRMRDTVKEHERKKQIQENKMRQNAKKLEQDYQNNLAAMNKRVTDNAFKDFEAEIAQFSSDMGSTTTPPETLPVIDSAAEISHEFADNLNTPVQEPANEHAN